MLGASVRGAVLRVPKADCSLGPRRARTGRSFERRCVPFCYYVEPFAQRARDRHALRPVDRNAFATGMRLSITRGALKSESELRTESIRVESVRIGLHGLRFTGPMFRAPEYSWRSGPFACNRWDSSTKEHSRRLGREWDPCALAILYTCKSVDCASPKTLPSLGRCNRQ